MAGEAERESFPDFPRVSFGIVGFDNVGDQTVDESTDHVNLTAKARSPAIEVRVLSERNRLWIRFCHRPQITHCQSSTSILE